MNSETIISRIDNIKTFIEKDELKNMKPESYMLIPSKVLEYVGIIQNVSYPQQGMCSLVTIIEGNKGKFILKIAKGEYRGKELYAEFLAIKELKNKNNPYIPITTVHAFFQENNLFYLLRDYSEGTPLNLLFQNSKDKKQRHPMLTQMSRSLSQIHRQYKGEISYETFIDAQLYFAKEHYKNNVIDLGDFVFDGVQEEPKAVLEWLNKNKPHYGEICLIHGDYRPKNILWDNQQITNIIDWAFCDIGDPYYDLAIFNDYLIDDQEREIFLQSYGIKALDEERLNYFYKMVPFINI